MIPRSYLFRVVGEDPKLLDSWHTSTINRTVAFGLAIHLPVLLWAGSSYLVARQVFELSVLPCGLLALGCAGLIYLIERLVLLSPRSLLVSLGRFLLGLVIAIIGALLVDLALFEKEISQQLHMKARASFLEAQEKKERMAKADLDQKYTAYRKAEEDAICEQNGRCGSGQSGNGPRASKLWERANQLRRDYEQAELHHQQVRNDGERELRALDASSAGAELARAGVLARFEALRAFAAERPEVRVVWGLLFLLVLAMELMVLAAKVVYKETVDDRIDSVRERVSEHVAQQYHATMVSPVRAATTLLSQTFHRQV